MKKNKRLKIIETIKEHILNNSKEYIIVSLIFVIGIFLGVLFVNNIQDTQKAEINTYLNNFISKFKEPDSVNNIEEPPVKHGSITTEQIDSMPTANDPFARFVNEVQINDSDLPF